MTDRESKIIDAVTAKLTGLRVGMTVFTKKGRMCIVHSLRECSTGGQWVRVRFTNSSTGNWEYHSSELTLT